MQIGDVIVVANSSKFDHGRTDRGDLVGRYPSIEAAYHAVERGVSGFASAVLTVEVVGRRGMRLPRGARLEDEQ